MLGQLNPKIKEVTVIGGGIAGLLAAYTLHRNGYEVELLEEGPRFGGLIQTTQTPLGITESAAHSILVTQKVKTFLTELELRLSEINPDSKARLILRNGKMKRFPLTVFESLRALLRSYFILSDRKSIPKNLTLSEWTIRYLGRPALTFLITPMLRGIYGASPQEISIGAAFPSLTVPYGHSFLSHQLAKFLRGQFKNKGPKKIMSPDTGMENLTRALAQYLTKEIPDRIHLNRSVRILPQNRNIVLAVPAKIAGGLINEQDPLLAEFLRQTKYTPLVTVTVFLEKDKLKTIPKGVGVLFPEVEHRASLGILFNSSTFPNRVSDPKNWISLTLMLGGTSKPDLVFQTDAEILELASKDLLFLFGYSEEIKHFQLSKWPQAIPQYNQDLMKTWEFAKNGWCATPGHILAGNYTGDVSIRGMIETMTDYHSYL